MEDEVAPGSPITIVIADDHPVARAGLRLRLDAQEGFEVLAEAGDAPTTEHRLSAYRPRVLILDPSMPRESSLRAIPRMRETSPDTQIVVLTMHNDLLSHARPCARARRATSSRRQPKRSSSGLSGLRQRAGPTSTRGRRRAVRRSSSQEHAALDTG